MMSAAEPTLAEALGRVVSARKIAERMVIAERTRLTSRLRGAREANGLTQQDVADVIGVTRSQVANIERGEGVSLEALIGFAGVVGLRLELVES